MKIRPFFKYAAAAALAMAVVAGADVPLHPMSRRGLVAAAWARGDDSPALNFTLRDLNGHAVHLSDFRGHPVIVDFWATWCPPCRRQIPELQKIYSRYKSAGLVVLGVAVDSVQGDGVAAVMPFAARLRINYPVLMANDSVMDQFGIQAIPTTLFVGPDGQMVGRITGAGRPGELTDDAQRLLKGSKSARRNREAKPDPNAVNI